jgi:transposase
MTRRKFSPEFKLDAASLVAKQGYTIQQACKATNVGETALRRWIEQYQSELAGNTPVGKAFTPDQQRIQTLERQVKQLELEKEILKKATALLMSEEMRFIR